MSSIETSRLQGLYSVSSASKSSMETPPTICHQQRLPCLQAVDSDDKQSVESLWTTVCRRREGRGDSIETACRLGLQVDYRHYLHITLPLETNVVDKGIPGLQVFKIETTWRIGRPRPATRLYELSGLQLVSRDSLVLSSTFRNSLPFTSFLEFLWPLAHLYRFPGLRDSLAFTSPLVQLQKISGHQFACQIFPGFELAPQRLPGLQLFCRDSQSLNWSLEIPWPSLFSPLEILTLSSPLGNSRP